MFLNSFPLYAITIYSISKIKDATNRLMLKYSTEYLCTNICSLTSLTKILYMHVSLNVCFSIRLVITRYHQMTTIVNSIKNFYVSMWVWVYLSMSLFIFAYMCYMCASVLVIFCDKILPIQTSSKQLWMTCPYKTINQPTEKGANKLTNKAIHSAEVWKLTSSAGKPKQKVVKLKSLKQFL